MGVVDPKSGHLEDSTPIHIHEKGAWTLSVKGGGLAQSKIVATGTDDALIPAWTGILKDGSGLGNGKYTLVLADQQQEPDGDGEPVKEVPIIITSLAMTVGATGDTLHAFSPGTASTKKTMPISIQANPALTWDLTASGPGGTVVIKTGTDATAPTPYQFQWDGKDINGIILKDGKYTLQLNAKGLPHGPDDPTASVIIDTTFPISVTVAGKEIFDGENNVFALLDTIVPVIRVHFLTSIPDNFDAAANTSITFSPRSDGVTPTVDRSRLYYDKSAKTVYYRVPLDQNQVLFAGDQTLTVSETSASRVVKTHTIPISVGSKTLLAAVPGNDSGVATAYHTLSTGNGNSVTGVPQGEPIDVPPPAPYKDPKKYRMIWLDTLKSLGGATTLEGRKWLAPVKRVWVVIDRDKYRALLAADATLVAAAAIEHAATYILVEGTTDSYTGFVEGAHNFGFKTKYGFFVTTDQTWADMKDFANQSGDPSMTRVDVARAIDAVAHDERRQFEFWTHNNHNPNDGLIVYRPADQINQLFHLKINVSPKSTNLLPLFDVVTPTIPGILGWSDPTKIWPPNLSRDQKQWSDTAREVLRYLPDYNEPNARQVWGHNWVPYFPYYEAGRIPDRQKPYEVDRADPYGHSSFPKFSDVNNAAREDPKLERPNGGGPKVPINIIGTIIPEFNPALLGDHWTRHGGKFDGLYGDRFAYQAGAQAMVHGFQGMQFYRAQTGDVSVFNKKNDYFAVWGANDRLLTHYPLGSDKVWKRMNGDEARTPYDPN
jgi:hypothetical protein